MRLGWQADAHAEQTQDDALNRSFARNRARTPSGARRHTDEPSSRPSWGSPVAAQPARPALGDRGAYRNFSFLGSRCPYKEGIDNGEKALHIVDAKLRDDHRRRLGDMGVDVPACERCGQLEVTTTAETYLAGGSFDTARMLAKIEEVISDARDRGFPRTRIMGNMSWALEGRVASDRLMEYEARVNDVLSRSRQPAICVYDASKLTGTLMLDILRTHPLTLVNGTVQTNPFFTPPHEFLRELRKRSENSLTA